MQPGRGLWARLEGYAVGGLGDAERAETPAVLDRLERSLPHHTGEAEPVLRDDTHGT